MTRDAGAAPAPSPGPFRYHFVRIVLRLLCAAYVRIRVEGAAHLPARPVGYVACFNHPSWLDPIILAAAWPDGTRRQRMFGPREADMTLGARNRIIAWTERAVPFRPHGSDALDASRRAAALLRDGQALLIAGEGRLSDREGIVRPIESGVAYFAQLAAVPILPVGIIGTRWVRFGKTIRIRIGEPIDPTAFPRGKAGTAALAAAVRTAMQALVEGAEDGPVPGRFGAWFSEVFNDRPWLDEAAEVRR